MDPKYSTGRLRLISLIWLRKHETKSKFTTRQTAGRQTNRKGGLVTVGGEIQIGSWAQIQSGEWANPAFAAVFNIADSPPAPVGSNLLARRSQTLSAPNDYTEKENMWSENPATCWKRNLGKEIRICRGSKSNLRIEQILRQLPRPLSADHHLPRSIPPQSGFVRLSLVFAFVTTSTTQRSVGCCQQYLLSSRK